MSDSKMKAAAGKIYATSGHEVLGWGPDIATAVADLLATVDRLEHPNRIDVLQVGIIAHVLAMHVLGEVPPQLDEQIEQASQAIEDAAKERAGRFADVPPFEPKAWPGTRAEPVSVSYFRHRDLAELGREQARIHGIDQDHAELYAEGWAAAWAQAGRIVEDLERQIRCVTIYGHSFLRCQDGTHQPLDPGSVMMVVPADAPETEMELLSRLSRAEAERDAAHRRLERYESKWKRETLGVWPEKLACPSCGMTEPVTLTGCKDRWHRKARWCKEEDNA